MMPRMAMSRRSWSFHLGGNGRHAEKNDGGRTNEEAFWACVYEIYGDKIIQDKALFERFYAVDFQQARSFCGYALVRRSAYREHRRRVRQMVQ